MLDAGLKTQLRSFLENLRHDIEITAHLDGSAGSAQVRALLDDLGEASARIGFRDGADETARVPSFSIGRPGEEPRVHFAGLPLGHEFTSLVLALLHVGGQAVEQLGDGLGGVDVVIGRQGLVQRDRPRRGRRGGDRQVRAHVPDQLVDHLLVAELVGRGVELLDATRELPVVGVVRPGARAVVAATRAGRVGVIGTRATIGSAAPAYSTRSV